MNVLKFLIDGRKGGKRKLKDSNQKNSSSFPKLPTGADPLPRKIKYSCEVVSLITFLAVIVPSVLAVFVYRSWRFSTFVDENFANEATKLSPISPKKTDSNNAAILSDERSWTKVEKEYDCVHMNGKPCSSWEIKGGPLPDLIKPIDLSKEDSSMFRSIIQFKNETEMEAANVTNKAIAFLFLTHGPMPLASLWERFFKGYESRYNIYVHTNPNFKYTKSDPKIFKDAQIRSEQAVWGQPQMVNAERRLLAFALSNPANHRFVLLSESCIPLRPFDQVWEYLFSTNLSFVESAYDPSFYGQGGYSPWMRPQIKSTDWRRGSQWWVLGRAHAYTVVQDKSVWFKVQKYCRGDKWHRYCHADEHYIQTLLYMRDGAGLANRSVTMADWTRGWAQPRVFRNTQGITVNAYREAKKQSAKISAVRQATNCSLPGEQFERNCFLFLRKVDPKALKTFERIASEILGY